jgi:hypothetical protein
MADEGRPTIFEKDGSISGKKRVMNNPAANGTYASVLETSLHPVRCMNNGMLP